MPQQGLREIEVSDLLETRPNEKILAYAYFKGSEGAEPVETPDRKRWTRHGSTHWLWKPAHISAAIQYVVAEQGEAMSVFESDEPEQRADTVRSPYGRGSESGLDSSLPCRAPKVTG